MALASPARPDHAPMARSRSSAVNDAAMSARLPGTSRAAATPCRARAATRTAPLGAAPQAAPRPRQAGGPPRRGAPRDKNGAARCGPAGRARDGEPAESDEEDAPASEDVPQRAADENERTQCQQVRVEDPLHGGEAGVEAGRHVGQRDVDDGAVE